MKFINELLPLRLYSSKKKVYMPVNDKDKRHGAAIFLMSSSQENNEKMMNAPFLYGPNNIYRSYYIDRNVMTYVNSDAINEIEEEFDEIKEAVLSEGMFHAEKTKFKFINASTMDERTLKKYFNDDALDYAKNATKIKNIPNEIIVKIHPNIPNLQKDLPNSISWTDQSAVYSFTEGNTIHLISYIAYDEDSMDGPYKAYCMHELIYCLIINTYPTISKKIATYTAMALSGQVEYLRTKKEKEEFRYIDSDKENINGLYIADLIYQLYESKGSSGIKRFLEGDINLLTKFAGRRIISATKKLFKDSLLEANLSTQDRKNLKDTDFGLPAKRKYPMPDEEHVRSAIRFFNHCDAEDEDELAMNIKSKMNKYNMKDVKIGKDNRLSKYIKTESYTESASIEDKRFEYSADGELFAGEYSAEYLAVLQILSDFDKEEFDRVSFNSTYKESKWIKKRIVLRDINGTPMSFMDIYHFPSDPERAQITTAVSKYYRGNHLCTRMFKKLLESGFAEENGIKKYIWHVHPGNDVSENIAILNGFKKTSEDLDNYGRYTYVYHINNSIESNDITLPMVTTESGIVLNESSVLVFNEVDSKYDTKMKKYLYKERLKNAREVRDIYNQVKLRNPGIDRTYRDIKLYKGLNAYVDTSYYHKMYLKNTIKGTKRSLYMYFDFLSRLMENKEISKYYSKITYFFPIQYTRDGQTIEDLLDYSKDLNPLSLIVYLVRKDPDVLKRWGNKEFLFIGDNGYFTINFKTFALKNMNRFKTNISRLLSSAPIIDEDEDFDEEESTKATAAQVIDQIENKSGISINNIAPVNSTFITHLSMEDTLPKLNTDSSSIAVFILTPDSNSAVSELDEKSLKSKDITSYYKPKA